MTIDEVSVRKRFSLIFSLYTLIFISTRFYTMNGKPLFSRKRRKQNLLVSTTEKILMQPEVDKGKPAGGGGFGRPLRY